MCEEKEKRVMDITSSHIRRMPDDYLLRTLMMEGDRQHGLPLWRWTDDILKW